MITDYNKTVQGQLINKERRTKKNTHRKNIKRTDVYGHKKKSESDRSPIPVTESF